MAMALVIVVAFRMISIFLVSGLLELDLALNEVEGRFGLICSADISKSMDLARLSGRKFRPCPIREFSDFELAFVW